MAKNIDTTSQEWCDLVFEGRNKNDCAYQMRRTSAKRHVVSFVIAILSFALIVSLPRLIELIEIYVFLHQPTDLSLENYKSIATPYEMQQLARLSIPEKAKPKPKSTIKKIEDSENQKIETPPTITEQTAIEAPMEDILKDSTLAENPEELDDTDKTSIDEGLFTIVEVMPSFPGGEAGLMDFIEKNLRYPAAVNSKNAEDWVTCTFIIETTGMISNIRVIQSAHPLLDYEAVRTLELSPQWKPALQHGKPVRVKYALPIVFTKK